jgi:hypothetical protein
MSKPEERADPDKNKNNVKISQINKSLRNMSNISFKFQTLNIFVEYNV